jgi:N-acetylmuramoyl-L-alanine amidase
VRRLELLQDARGLEVRLEASAPVRVTSIQLAHPSRCVIDITSAWFHLDGTPRPAGMVRSVRLGQFTRDTARIVMELTDGAARITGLPQSGTAVTARLQSADPARLARAGEPAAAVQKPSSEEALASPAAVAGPAAVTPSSSPTPVAERRSASTVTPRRRHTARHRTLASRGGYVHRALVPPIESIGGALTGRVICVDPGHGGPDAGALGLHGLTERDACLAMANELARALREAGATVLMTREGDRYVSLEDRYTFANLKAADIYISIHCNAMAHHNTMSGTETYYWTPQSLDLARAVHPEVLGVMARRDGGIRQRQFAVIHHTTMPSILLEVGYIDNTGDEAKLGDPAFQEAFGIAVRDGVIRYFGG